MGPSPFFGYKIQSINHDGFHGWKNMWWMADGTCQFSMEPLDLGDDWCFKQGFSSKSGGIGLGILWKVSSFSFTVRFGQHYWTIKRDATKNTMLQCEQTLTSTNMDLEFDAFHMDLLRCTSGIPLVCGNGQKNHWNDVSLPNSVEQSWLHYDEICIIPPPKSRNLRILQCLVSEDSWRRPICSWRAIKQGSSPAARGEHGNFTGNIGEFGPWIGSNWVHGSLVMSPLNITQPLGIWSIMATIFGDVQYSQNGTFTNPWGLSHKRSNSWPSRDTASGITLQTWKNSVSLRAQWRTNTNQTAHITKD